MRSSSLLAVSVALLSSISAAESDQPKFYVPRQVKRQSFSNITFTPPPALHGQQVPSRHVVSTSSSSKRSVLDELFNDLTSSDGIFPASSAGTTGDSVAANLPPLSSSSTSSEPLTTVIVSNTVVVSPDMTSTASPQPTVTPPFDPFSDLGLGQGASGTSPSSTAPTTGPSTDGGITFGPSGVITSSSVTQAPAAVTPTSSVASDAGLTFSGSSAASSTGGGNFLSSLLDPILPPTSATVDLAPSSTPISTSTPTASVPTSATDNSLPSTTASADPSTTGDPLLAISLGSSTTDASSTAAPTSDGITGAATGTTDAPTATDSSSAASSTDPGNILSSIMSGTVVATSDSSSPTSSGSPTDTASGSITATGTDATATASDLPTGTTDTGLPTGTSASGSVVTDSPTSTSGDVNGFATSISGNITSATAEGILPPTTSLPTVTATDGTLLNGTTAAGSSTSTATPTASDAGTAGSMSITATGSTTELAGTPSATSQAPQTILPTGTDSATSQFVEPSILVQPSATGAGPTSTTLAATGIPTTLPQLISPSNGIPDIPEGNSLFQVGFVYALNYEFVVDHFMSSAQIFKYIPIGISGGLGISADKVVMYDIEPLDLTATEGYIATLALFYAPSNMASTLAVGIKTPVSGFYTNSDKSVATMMDYINPAISIYPGTGTGGGSSKTGSSSAASSSVSNNDVFNTDQQNQSASSKGTMVGVVLGGVAAAGAYGAAMFFVARRYKRRKSGHRRASSIQHPSEMRQTGSPALMGGAFMAGGRLTPGLSSNDRNSRGSGRSAGNSARTAQISAPMMAENSLGWN